VSSVFFSDPVSPYTKLCVYFKLIRYASS